MSDVKLEGESVIVEGLWLKAKVLDLWLFHPSRLSPGTDPNSARRAMVHNFGDGVGINVNRDYPGGVQIGGVVQIQDKLKISKIEADKEDITVNANVNFGDLVKIEGKAPKAPEAPTGETLVALVTRPRYPNYPDMARLLGNEKGNEKLKPVIIFNPDGISIENYILFRFMPSSGLGDAPFGKEYVKMHDTGQGPVYKYTYNLLEELERLRYEVEELKGKIKKHGIE